MQKPKKILAGIFSLLSVVFFSAVAGVQTALGQWDKSKLDATKLPHSPISTIINKFLFWLLAIFGFIAVIGFVISGIMYILSAGDEDTQERAKRAMIYSITGVIVGLSGIVILQAIQAFLNGAPPTN